MCETKTKCILLWACVQILPFLAHIHTLSRRALKSGCNKYVKMIIHDCVAHFCVLPFWKDTRNANKFPSCFGNEKEKKRERQREGEERRERKRKTQKRQTAHKTMPNNRDARMKMPMIYSSELNCFETAKDTRSERYTHTNTQISIDLHQLFSSNVFVRVIFQWKSIEYV